jgi:hypothetical protein
LHYGALPILKNMVQGLLDFKVEKKGVCKGYTPRKHVKVAFPSSKHRSREILDLIHLDVCGPMSSASLLGNIYHVSLLMIREVSRFQGSCRQSNKQKD